jgi:hypothetical protein
MDKAIQAAQQLLDWFFQHYGPRWTLLLIFLVPVAFVGWQIWLSWRKDKVTDKALEAKEETIQRLADDNRTYRILFFKEKCGWTDDQIERWLLLKDPGGNKEPGGNTTTKGGKS